MRIYKYTIVAILLFIGNNTTLFAQPYEIVFDSLSASGWFGGDDREGFARNVAVAQSVTIDEPINLETFSFYITNDFDFAANPTGSGHEVTLRLHVRDSVGTILQTEDTVVPDSFNGGWVMWSDINLDIITTGKYIFSTYLVGGYDSIKVNSGQGCDQYAGYPYGERYAKYANSDSAAEVWGDWSPHSWDSDFKLTGNVITTAVEKDNGIIDDFRLEQNYPNPFNPNTKIRYTIPNVGTSSMKFVKLKIYDILGNEIATLVNEEKPAGSYEVEFDASSLTSGVYFYTLNAGSFTQTRKMLLLK